MKPELLDYRRFDADNGYYDAHDTFARRVPVDMAPRAGLSAKVDDMLGAVMARALPKTFHV